MKYLKTLILVVIAAHIAAAFAVPGAASATVLCKTNSTPCSEKYAAGTEFSASLASETQATFSTFGGTVLYVCSGSSMAGKVAAAGSSTETSRISVPASGLTWSSCSRPMTTLKEGELEVHWLSGSGDGTLTLKGLEISVDTEPFGICNYSSGSSAIHMGSITGGAAPTIHVSAVLQMTSTSSLTCRGPAWWKGTYTVTKPTPIYVREA